MIIHVRKCINKDLCQILVSSLPNIDYCCSVLQGIHVCRLLPISYTIRAYVCKIFRIHRSDYTSISANMRYIPHFIYIYIYICIINIQQRSIYRTLCIVIKAILTNRRGYISDMIYLLSRAF